MDETEALEAIVMTATEQLVLGRIAGYEARARVWMAIAVLKSAAEADELFALAGVKPLT